MRRWLRAGKILRLKGIERTDTMLPGWSSFLNGYENFIELL